MTATARKRKQRTDAPGYEDRIADQIFAAIDAGTIDPLVAWLCSLGCTVVSRDDGVANLQGLVNMRAALVLADPCTMAVQVGFLLAGMYWPHVYPRLLHVVNARWKARSEKARTT